MHENAKDCSRATQRCWRYLGVPVAALALGVAATLAVSQSRQEPYVGVYRQEVVPVLIEQSGRILDVERPHGELVEPGDPLCRLEDASASQTLQALKSRRDPLTDKLNQAAANSAVDLAVRNDAIEKERLETRLRYADLLRTRLDVQLRIKALQDLEQNPSVAGTDRVPIALASAESQNVMRQLGLADASNHEEVLDTQIALCEERLAELDSLQKALPGQIERSCGVDRIEAELAEIDSQIAALQEATQPIVITSPAYGRVGVYRRPSGAFMASGETLVEIFDSERPYILLTVPISKLRELTAGRRVLVKFEGITTRKSLEGTVASVTSEAERDAEAALAPGSAQAQVKITPAGRIWPTPPAGSTVRVYLLSDAEQPADKT